MAREEPLEPLWFEVQHNKNLVVQVEVKPISVNSGFILNITDITHLVSDVSSEMRHKYAGLITQQLSSDLINPINSIINVSKICERNLTALKASIKTTKDSSARDLQRSNSAVSWPDNSLIDGLVQSET